MIARLRKSDLIRHGLLVFGGVAVSSVFNYLYFMLLGRIVDVAAYGAITSLASALLVIGAPATVMQLVTARLAADLADRHDDAALRRLADRALQLSLAGAALVLLIGWISRNALAAYFQIPDPAAIVITALAIGLFAVMTVQRGILQGSHHFGDFSMSLIVETSGKVAAGVLLALTFGVNGALYGIVIGCGAAIVTNEFAFRRRFGRRRGAVAIPVDLIRRVFAGVGLGQLSLTVLMFYDVPLVKHFFDPQAAGYYAAAALVGRAVIAAVSFVPTLILPKTSVRVARGESPLPLLASAVGLAVGIVVAGALIAGIAPRFVVTTIAGRGFALAAPLVFWYVIASGCLSIAAVIAAYKIGLHQYDFALPVFAVAVAEIVVICVWHPSPLAVIGVLVSGHACVFATLLFKAVFGAPLARPSDAVNTAR